MKVYLFAYSKTNFGDDLFIQILTNRYKKIEFYIKIEDLERDSKFLENISNLHVVEIKDEFEVELADYDAIVYIGGSIFMETKNSIKRMDRFKNFMEKCNASKIPFFYISSNFGPYTTQEFYNKARETFGLCEDLCFRDRYSKKLFKDMKNIRYATDAVFSYNLRKTKVLKNSVAISVIDLEIKKLEIHTKKYESFLINNIKKLIELGKKVYLFSFCEFEGDTRCINKIMEKLPEEYKSNIEEVYYTGNISEFMEKYQQMEYAICTRFHAMILSILFGHKFITVSYSDKLKNVILDLKLKNLFVDIKNLDENKIYEINEYKKVKKLKTIFSKIKSKKQFEAFDKCQNRR